MELHGGDIEKLLLAALLGGVLGIDREYRGKAAGLRTLILVSLGAALFTIVSFRMAEADSTGDSDGTRIASNIVTGIGFLGAGLIFKDWTNIKGLTTAATVWAAAALGMAAGIGYFSLAIIATVIIWITLFFLHYVENMMMDMVGVEVYKVSWRAAETSWLDPAEFFAHRVFSVKERKIIKDKDLIIAHWTIKASKTAHEDVVRQMLKDPRIVSLEH